MKKGSFRTIGGSGGGDGAANRAAHIPHKVPEQLPGRVKSAQAKAKSGHMKVNAPSGMKLPFSL